MKNVIFISTFLAAGTLAANAATTLNYADVGNFNNGNWWNDNNLFFRSSSLEQSSGFYTFKTSEYDFSNLKSAKFNIYLSNIGRDTDLKIWVVEHENTGLNENIANEIIKRVNTTKGFVSTSLTAPQKETVLSIDIISVLKKIAKGKDVAILIGQEGSVNCFLDYKRGAPTTLSVELGQKFSLPEPSAFGLLAGLGALALAGTRRRR